MNCFPHISKTFSLALICLLLTLLPSCLTLSETYEFKKNGSGSMTYLIDMAELANILKIAEENNEDSTGNMAAQFSFKEVADTLSSFDGISHVNVIDDREKYHFGISFRFKSIDVLNQALNYVLITNPEGKEHVFFKMEGNTITRTNFMNKEALNSQLDGSEISPQSISLMESMVYKMNFSFSKPVKVVYSSAEAEMGGKKNREVKLETTFKTLMDDVSALNTSIVLR